MSPLVRPADAARWSHRGPSRRALAALVLAVLALHLLLLWTIESPLALRLSGAASTPMRWRVVDAPPAPAPSKPLAQAPARRQSPSSLKPDAPDVPAPVPMQATAETAFEAASKGADQALDAPASAALAPESAPAPHAEVQASAPEVAAQNTTWPLVPLGALPPSMVLSYRLTGMDKGLNYFASGELRWQHNDQAYELTLSVRAFLIGSRRWHSQGRIEAAGLAPQRFADSWRNERAAHFDRSGQRIVFSSNSTPAVLEAGAQDQISLYVQLAAAMAGEPERFVPGTRLQLQTVTTRDALPWSLVLQGQEDLELEGERRPVHKWVCQPHNRYEAKVEFWVSAAQAWMPVRIRITQNSGSYIDLLWRGTEPLPPLPTAAVGSAGNTRPQGS